MRFLAKLRPGRRPAPFEGTETAGESTLAASIELLWRFWARGESARALAALDREYQALIDDEPTVPFPGSRP
jgi:hypothetical protein